jgi:hypothetical protein
MFFFIHTTQSQQNFCQINEYVNSHIVLKKCWQRTKYVPTSAKYNSRYHWYCLHLCLLHEFQILLSLMRVTITFLMVLLLRFSKKTQLKKKEKLEPF